jgi:hypothetical protein
MEPKLGMSAPSKFAIIQPKKFGGADLTLVSFALAPNILNTDMHYFSSNLASRIKTQILK